MQLISPAKINIGLEVGHRRPEDGYHYIASVLIPISFGDELHIEESPQDQDSFASENHLFHQARSDFEAVSERGNPENNLLVQILRKSAPYRTKSLHLRLVKRIPSGAGLGGGSSNAGLLLSYLCQRSLVEPRYAWQLALETGADVPFFMQPAAALLTGIGERRKPIKVGTGLGLLALSGIVINTKEAYRGLKRPLQRKPHPETLQGWSRKTGEALAASRWVALKSLINDFEDVVFSMYPLLKEVKRAFLAEGAQYALLSGTGSSLYGLVATEKRQGLLARRMQDIFPGIHFVPFCF